MICDKRSGLPKRSDAFAREYLPGLAQDLVALMLDNVLEVGRHIKPQICGML